VNGLVSLLATDVPPAHRRACSFALSRMLLSSDIDITNAIKRSLHTPFLNPKASQGSRSPNDLISILQTLLTNMDPSPTLISSILTPLVPTLYNILAAFERVKSGDPSIKESLKSLLLAWGRIVSADEATAVLWACIEDQGGIWAADIAGNIKHVDE
jgi:hypothetical protein